MAFWINLMQRFDASIKAFREPDIVTDPFNFDSDFGEFDSRRLRYDLHWSFYENNVYRDIHRWSKLYKTQYGLDRYIRGVYNPSYRLGEFWKSHLWGGSLFAGEEESVQVAIPIVTDNDSLRDAINTLWMWSNWQINKDICTLYGSILGDVAIKVIDKPDREKIYLEVVNPSVLAEVQKDEFGNVKGYVIQESRLSPEGGKTKVTYTEKAFRDGDDVVYETYLNNALYVWPENESAQWVVPYGFIPMVVIQHNNVGLEWGWAELQSVREKIIEIDGQASKLNDHIRKVIAAPGMAAGVAKPNNTPIISNTEKTGTAALNDPFPGREEMSILYAPSGATWTPMTGDLDIPSTIANVDEMIKGIEEDLPELRASTRDAQGVSAEKSGKAIRESRRNAERKVMQRRPNYDDALVRVQKMGVAIGGFRGYEGFNGFNLDSFAAGDLNHNIGKRPVFTVDPLDDIELVQAKATTFQSFVSGGASIYAAAILSGFSEEQAQQLQAIEIPQEER